MFGPQLYPTLTYLLHNGPAITVYGKYSPVTNGFAAPTFASHELAGGISTTFIAFGRRPLGVALDYSNLVVEFPGLSSIRARSISLGVSLQW